MKPWYPLAEITLHLRTCVPAGARGGTRRRSISSLSAVASRMPHSTSVGVAAAFNAASYRVAVGVQTAGTRR
jgi:hypothetical protein